MSFNSLSKLTARDIMKSTVFKLDPQNSLEEAVRMFSDMRISGAPVVDRMGRLVGVLSARDIAQPENMRDPLRSSRGAYTFPDASPDDDGSYDEDVVFSMDDYSPEVVRAGSVGDVMTADPITVAPDVPLRSICALMVREGIHRVIVVEREKLVGIVTTMDIARAVADAT
jgi:CBS domain-containing protein